MKKISWYAVSICIVLFLFCGCAGSKDGNAEDGLNENITHLVMTYQTMDNSRLEDLDKVVDAVNEISRKEIGVEIELKVSSALTQFDDYPLWLSQGKVIDLMILNYQNILPYIEQDLIYPLDSLLESDGKGILELMEESGQALLSGTILHGEGYGLGIPAVTSGSGCGIWIPVRYLEEIGFPYEENHIYSMEALDILFARLKANYPEKYPLGLITAGSTFSSYTYFGNDSEALGYNTSTGVLGKNGQLVNRFEMLDYIEYLGWMQKWYEMEYIYPDAAFTDGQSMEFFKEGITMSVPTSSSPGIVSEEYVGEEIVCLETKVPSSGIRESTGVFWVIPKTSSAPDAAMKFLNLMYTNETVINLLAYGIEGEDYEFLDKEKGIIVYPDGLNSSTVGYNNPLGMYGDQRKKYVFDSDELRKKLEAYEARIVRKDNMYEGFIFDQEELNVELLKVQDVLKQYLPVLECGCVELDVVYPEFIQKLKEAGIEKIITEKQTQFDLWKKNNP